MCIYCISNCYGQSFLPLFIQWSSHQILFITQHRYSHCDQINILQFIFWNYTVLFFRLFSQHMFINALTNSMLVMSLLFSLLRIIVLATSSTMLLPVRQSSKKQRLSFPFIIIIDLSCPFHKMKRLWKCHMICPIGTCGGIIEVITLPVASV